MVSIKYQTEDGVQTEIVDEVTEKEHYLIIEKGQKRRKIPRERVYEIEEEGESVEVTVHT